MPPVFAPVDRSPKLTKKTRNILMSTLGAAGLLLLLVVIGGGTMTALACGGAGFAERAAERKLQEPAPVNAPPAPQYR